MPFSQKNVHTFFVCFSFFPLKKQKSIYTKGENKGCIYTFLFFKWKKGKTNKKSMYIFFVKNAL